MKAIISAIIVAGALSQMANAMGPMGDITHRHFYKDQEWLWQDEQSQPKLEPSNEAVKFEANHVWALPSAFVVPTRPSVAFVVPTRPSVAFVVPTRPSSVAFVVPTRPSSVAFVVPTRPSVAFVVPTRPSVAFVVPTRPSLAF